MIINLYPNYGISATTPSVVTDATNQPEFLSLTLTLTLTPPRPAPVPPGDYQGVKNILDREPERISKRDSDGWSCLHWGCCHGWLNVVELLLERGIRIDYLDRLGKSTLH